MIIVAGATGSGKSTTIAAMIDYINHHRKRHLLTPEDPTPHIFHADNPLTTHRAIGLPTDTYDNALKFALREDPDVILMGEMRDAETVATGLTAAETGHLVFGTLHASNAPQVVGRLLDVFPGDKQQQMRKSLVFNLRAVVCQKLLRCTKKDRRRVPACEVMICTPGIQKRIEEGQDRELHRSIRDGEADGMIDFLHSIHQLVQNQLVTKREALANSANPSYLQSMFDGLEIS
jgi:twitching motility protein PilT